MSTEPDTIKNFLERSGWRNAERSALAGDASFRRYERVSDKGQTAVLMIAPTDRGEDTRPFLRVADHLVGLGLSAPQTLARDTERGLLLIEDLGNDLFARVASTRPDLEPVIYRAAVDVLVRLHEQPVPSWADPYDRDTLYRLAALAFEWYAGCPVPAALQPEFLALCDATNGLTDVLALRDFHAENLLWLPDRGDVARVGLLDFQDAMAGHRAYDLVSLVGDARRELSPGLAESLVDYYLTRTGLPKDEFRRAVALMGAQRNMRILGVFSRLAIRDAKPGYLKLLPGVWAHLVNDLAHPAFARLQDIVLSALPRPDAGQIDRLMTRCTQTP